MPEKYFDLENNLIERFQMNYHNMLFTILLAYSLFFWIEGHFFDFAVSRLYFEYLPTSLPSSNVLENEYSIDSWYFVNIFLISLSFAFFASLYFYIRYGGQVDRLDVHRGKLYFNSFAITTIISLIVVLFLSYGGVQALKYLVFGVHYWHLNTLPLSDIFQTIVMLYLQTFMAMIFNAFFLMLYPYSLHPSKSFKN